MKEESVFNKLIFGAIKLEDSLKERIDRLEIAPVYKDYLKKSLDFVHYSGKKVYKYGRAFGQLVLELMERFPTVTLVIAVWIAVSVVVASLPAWIAAVIGAVLKALLWVCIPYSFIKDLVGGNNRHRVVVVSGN